MPTIQLTIQTLQQYLMQLINQANDTNRQHFDKADSVFKARAIIEMFARICPKYMTTQRIQQYEDRIKFAKNQE